MKHALLYTIALLLFAGSLVAQTPGYSWANSITGDGNDVVSGITVGADGLPVVSGYFDSYTIMVSDTTITGYHNYFDAFIIKYNTDGSRNWVREIYGPVNSSLSDILTESISADATGNIYVTGDYSDSIYFANGIALPDNSTTENAFLAKYNSAGVVQWARRVKGATGSGVAPGVNGNIVMSGAAFSSDSLNFTDTLLLVPNDNHAVSFVVQYDSTGARQWVRTIVGGTLTSIAANSAGDIYATGYLDDTVVNFGNNVVLTNTDQLNFTEDIFVAKYSATGVLQWAKGFGGNDDDKSNTIATDAAGNVLLAGNFLSETLSFGSYSLSSNDEGNNIFITKLDALGNILWAHSSTASNALSIATGAANSVFISGDFLDTIAIFNTDTLHTSAHENIFIAKYDSAGVLQWEQTTTDTSSVLFAHIANDAFGNTYLAADFQGAVLDLGNTILAPDQGTDAFVAKLGDNGSTTGLKNIIGNGISVYPNPSTGNFYFTGLSAGSTLEVYNLLGEKIYSAALESDNYRLNLANVAKGMYLYRISTTANAEVAGKVLVE